MDDSAPAATCPTCGWAAPREARFCPQCGVALGTSPALRAHAWSAASQLSGRAARRLLSALAGSVRGLGRLLRTWLGFARVLVASWAQAGRALVRVRSEQHRLQGDHKELISTLGWAVYHDDLELADLLKAAARACSEQIERGDRALQRQVEAARERVGRERFALRRTAVLATVERSAPDGADDDR